MGKLICKGRHTVKVGNHPHINMISKPAKVRREYKGSILEMHWKLRDKQLKTILCTYRLLYQNLMGTTNQKSTKDTHRKRKENPKTTLKLVIKSQEKRTKQEGNKKTYKNKSKTIFKIAIKKYILIITLNINGLNAPTKRHRLVEWIQKQDLYICC